MFFLVLLACPEDQKTDTGATVDTDDDDTAALDTGDTAADTGDTDEEASCLVLDPDAVDLVGETRSAYVAYSGCIEEISAMCDAPFSMVPPDPVQYLFLVSVDASTSTAAAGTCTVTSSGGSTVLPVSYTP